MPDNLRENWGKSLRQSTKDGIQMTNKCTKNCSTTLVIWEKQTEKPQCNATTRSTEWRQWKSWTTARGSNTWNN